MDTDKTEIILDNEVKGKTLLLLAKDYYMGKGVPCNRQIAKKFFIESATFGNDMAMYMLARIYEEEGNYIEARKWALESSKLGNAEAVCFLGATYYFGEGVECDLTKAKECFEEAIKLGSTEAMCNLGKMYYFGYGVPQNYDESLKLFDEAAKSGNLDARKFLNCAKIGHVSTNIKNGRKRLLSYLKKRKQNKDEEQ